MKISDRLAGGLLALLAFWVLWHVQSYPPMPGQKINAAFFPTAIAIGLLVCAALLIARDLKKNRPRLAEALPWVRSKRHLTLALAAVALVIAYIVLSDKLGFILSGGGVLLAIMLLLGVSALRAVLIAVVAAFVLHYAFYKLLRVPLPWGVLPVLY